MKGTLIFAQSGGPTAVINAGACGVFHEAQRHGDVTGILAARYGIEGVLREDFIDVSQADSREVDLLRVTPAAAFGSCRKKLPSSFEAEEYARILDVFQKHNVRYFIYSGGNDSMDTCNKIAKFMRQSRYECSVIGVPKTVDNDLACTDHSPGFGSAAKYIATTCHEIALDTAAYRAGRVTVVEIMGRDAGWLTASSALATAHGAGPDLIYLPERPFDVEKFAADCQTVMNAKGHCLVAISEGIRDGKGQYVAAMANNAQKDAFSHVQLGGAANFLAAYLSGECGIKSRAIELSLPQRCAGHLASATDAEEAYAAGMCAVRSAVDGDTNKMVVFRRISDTPYRIAVETAELDGIANAVRHMPDEFITTEGNFVTEACVRYIAPLILGENTPVYENGLPRYSKIGVNARSAVETPHS